MQSIVQTRGHVSFPDFKAERVYMRPFRQEAGLPQDLKRWQRTVDDMLEGIDARGRDLYIMIDQSIVVPGKSQRRPGVHIDGYWIAGPDRWDTGNGRWKEIRAHGTGRHGGGDGTGHGTGRHGSSIDLDGWKPEALLLASDVSGCNAYEGEFEGQIGKGGDCTHLRIPMRKYQLCSGRVHSVNVTGLHESIPLVNGGPRTLVRINVPGWSPELCV